MNKFNRLRMDIARMSKVTEKDITNIKKLIDEIEEDYKLLKLRIKNQIERG